MLRIIGIEDAIAANQSADGWSVGQVQEYRYLLTESIRVSDDKQLGYSRAECLNIVTRLSIPSRK